MASSKIDPEIIAHLEWLGFVRPTGLVVSAPALVRAGAILDRRDAEGQRLLRACVAEHVFDAKEGAAPYVPDFRRFADSVLGWNFSPKGYAGTTESPIPTEIEVPLPDYGETLRPDFAVRELEPKDGASIWQLLVRVLDPGEDFDRVVRGQGQLEASAQGRMERLLRQTGVPAGLLFNGRALRLVSAPRGESSGWLDFRVADMVQTAGRPISTALRLLLGQSRLLSLPLAQRLSALLEDSRKFQNEVSEKLAEQVLHALYELLRGFQAAHDATKGELLHKPLAEHPDEVYRALLTVILRLVFLLYAEDRDMLPEDETFLRYYSLAGLYERLREDAALFPDTMDQRYGAWAQLLVLFRMIYDGAESGVMRLPKRHGVLFDPDRFTFLEGRSSGNGHADERIQAPLVPDGTIYRALEKLLVLDGERISYRALDVEQIGSVYETMMGFLLETTTGRSVAIKAQKTHGAPTAVDLEALIVEPGGKREKWLQNRTDRKLTDAVKKAVTAATTLEDLHSALLPVIDLAATPDLVSKGAMVLQPSEERRRSGSHYTPRALTEPIVRTTLDPIVARLRAEDGGPPRTAQILDLKVCDPAMGSGAFLVEACRQLGDALIEAWHTHGEAPAIPPDEDEVIFARRLVAQRCLYGVDKNPIAVDLAKMSLWLATLAKDHALTFVDHALRHGDSLVGLSRKQIEVFHWNTSVTWESPFRARMRDQLRVVAELRQQIRGADETVSDRELRDFWDQAQFELGKVRLFGDLVVAAFFEGQKPQERETKRSGYVNAVVSGKAEQYRERLDGWRNAEKPLTPFHWEIEFPEVFERENPGFDAMVGNPPFLGGAKIWPVLGGPYTDWLRNIHENSGGKAVDLVAHFFRRTNNLTRFAGNFGLIATKTISEGDTRAAGLKEICKSGSHIYEARRRFRWPGLAAVVISVIHVVKGENTRTALLDGRPVSGINSFLFPLSEEFEAKRLRSNKGLSFRGCDIYGLGFLFSDEGEADLAGTISQMKDLIQKSPSNSEVIFPFIGGKELVTHPRQMHHRYAINFADMTLEEARRWPDLLDIVDAKVKPQRALLGGYPVADRRREYWWQYGTFTPALYRAIQNVDRVLAISQTTTYICFAFLPSRMVFSQKLIILPALGGYAEFALLQSRIHEAWALLWGSTQGDTPVYSPPDCLETFPFPQNWKTYLALEVAGKVYYEYRAALMVKNDEGLTKTYSRFHDCDERDPQIAKLRDLHAAMDRTLLDAYGWSDIKANCEFFLEFEIDEEEWGDKKKPWRYRWPDEVRDEVLARLLKLNAERAKEEARSGAVAGKQAGKKAAAKHAPKRAPKQSDTENLFS
jgi:hypothetical protein